MGLITSAFATRLKGKAAMNRRTPNLKN